MRKVVTLVLIALALSGCASSRRLAANARPAGLVADAGDKARLAKEAATPPSADPEAQARVTVAFQTAMECTRTNYNASRRTSTASDAIHAACTACRSQWAEGDKAAGALIVQHARTAAKPSPRASVERLCLSQQGNFDRDYLRSMIPRPAAPPATAVPEPGKRGWDI